MDIRIITPLCFCRLQCITIDIPRPFPILGKGAALEDIPPSCRQKIEQPGPSVKGKPPV